MAVYLRRSLLVTEVKDFIKVSLRLETEVKSVYDKKKVIRPWDVVPEKDLVIIPFGFYQTMREKFDGKAPCPVLKKQIKIVSIPQVPDPPKETDERKDKEEPEKELQGEVKSTSVAEGATGVAPVEKPPTAIEPRDLSLTSRAWPKFPNDALPFEKVEVKFKGQLRPNQVPAFEEFRKHINETRGCLLKLGCAFGKTVISVYGHTVIKLRVLFLSHLVTLVDQFNKTYAEFTDGKLHQITSDDLLLDELPEADAYSCTPMIINQFSAEKLRKIGMLIVDETESFCTDEFHRAMLQRVKIVVALTATPDNRPDGMGKMLPLIFGPRRVERSTIKPFKVFRFNTGCKPHIQQNMRGGLDWSEVIRSVSTQKKRNLQILQWVKMNPKRKILIFCIRKEMQAEPLMELLKSHGEDSSLMIGNTRHYSQTRIVIATIGKLGKGFDGKMSCIEKFDGKHYDMLILAWTVKDAEQIFGRGERADFPVVVDMVDDFSSFRKHFDLREAFYKRKKGVIAEAKEPFCIDPEKACLA